MSKPDNEDAPASIDISVESAGKAAARQDETGPRTQPSVAGAEGLNRDLDAAPLTEPANAPPTQPATAPPTAPDGVPAGGEPPPARDETAALAAESRLRSQTLVSVDANEARGSVLGWLSAPRHADAAITLGIYALCSLAFLLCASKNLLVQHTPYNHFAHLARAWLNGELHLADGPPAYARNNDFARFQGEWYVTFPPFPALLLLPFVALAGEICTKKKAK